MQICLLTLTGKPHPLECESTDTIIHIKERVQQKFSYPPADQQKLYFRGQHLGISSLNKTLAEAGIQNGDKLILSFRLKGGGAGVIERPRRIIDRPQRSRMGYLHYADAFKYGWREKHGETLMHLLLKLYKDGGLEGNMTDEAWLQIQNAINNLTNMNFQIDFLKQRLCDYKQLYSLLADETFPFFNRQDNTFSGGHENDWLEIPELLLVCSGTLPYFDTLEKVCLFQSPQQQVFKTSK